MKFLSYILRLRTSRHPSRHRVTIVVAGAADQDRGALNQAGDREQLYVRFTDSCAEAFTIANQLAAPVILCNRDLPQTEWRVFRIGGFDILAKPPRAEEVRPAVNLALSFWRSQAATAVRQSG
jgi:hypothetical protein